MTLPVRPVRSAYIIKTLHWGRYPDMYGEEWVDIESIAHKESLSEAITYADDQCKLPKTIEAKVYSTFNNELMYSITPRPTPRPTTRPTPNNQYIMTISDNQMNLLKPELIGSINTVD